ncbi:MAG: N-acetyltransferase [Chitinophagaceae bacterium]
MIAKPAICGGLFLFSEMLELNFEPFPVLETERLILRQIRPADADDIFYFRSDPDMLRYLDREPAKSVDEALQWIQMVTDLCKKGDGINWAICLKGSDKLIGMVTLWNIRKEHYRAEAGYTLHASHQGKGIMQEAFQKVIDYGFRKINLHSIDANVNPANEASIKVLEKAGFVREAYFRENYYHNGKFSDSAIYSLLSPYPYSDYPQQ